MPLLALGQAPIVSTFSASAEGWTGVSLNCGGNYAPIVAQRTLTYLAAGGAPGSGPVDGHIRLTDTDGVCQFFNAPAPFTGNKAAYFGGRLSFSLRCNTNTWPNDNVVVLVPSSGTPLVAIVELPPTTWRAYDVPLTPGTWRVGSKTGAQATEAQLRAALSSLAALRLPAEFGATFPEENADLDEVRLVGPCGPADIAGPNQSLGGDGTLTADDIIVYLGWYFASDLRADVAGANQSTTPDTQLTADDIIVFLGRYFAGC
jgi:hypothetical protein